jgi:hypothetical protein
MAHNNYVEHVVNYAKTSERSGVWHRLRTDDDEPSYCGLGMLRPQHWSVKADSVPANELLCMRCANAVRWIN